MKNKMKKITGSLLSFVLAASMVTGLSGMTALADEGDPVTENLTETQTIIVNETVDGTADSSFAFHIYQITDAEKPIESEEDIVLSEAGSNLSYLIYDASTDEEIGDGTTGSDGSFTLNAEEYAEFTVLAETDWYVEQDTPEEYPLTDVTAEGDHASVVGSIDGDYVYGVVQYTDETVEPTPTADKPDKTALQEAVEKAQALEESDYTPESWEALEKALENAEKVLADPDATEEEIEQALKDLEDAEAGLEPAEPEPTPDPDSGVDKSALQEEYNEDAVIQQGDYTPESWETFEEALKKAEDVLNDDDATQEEVDQALEDLRDAKEGLKEREEVDKSALQAEYDDDYTLEESDYTPETWEPFEEAMEHAKDVLKDEDATQAEVDEALNDLTDAREALERVSEPDPNAPSVTVTSNLTGNSKTYDAESVTLTAEATGSEGTTLTYQWYTVDPETGERRAIEGATESTYTLDGDVSDSGMYICTVTATDGAGNEASTSKAITITIAKAAQEISYAETLIDKTTGSAAFTNELTKTVVDPADGSGITYKSSNDSIASVDENGVVTIHAKGTVTITATAAATANYKEASAAYVLVVTEDGTEPEPNPNPEPTEPTVTNVAITAEGLSANHTKTYDSEGVTLTVTADTAPAGADVTYQWYKKNANGEYEAIEGATESTYTLAGDVSDSGSYQCVVTVTNDGESASAEAEITVTIEPAAQEISYAESAVEKTTNADPFVNELTETVVYPEDGAGITYASSNESVALVDAVTGEVTIVGTGEATITATAAATDNYAGASASYTVTVREPVAPTVNVIVTSSLIDNAKTYDGDGVSLTAWTTHTPDGATLTFQWYKKNANGEYEAIDGAIYSVWNLTGDVSDSGTYKCVVTAQNDGLEASAEAEITITIEPAAQEISYENGVVTKYDHDDDFTNPLTETIVYGEITYASSNGDVATVDPETGEVTITGTGYTTITATAAEVDNYKEAKASYILFVNTDAVEWEVEVNHEHMTWDEGKGEYVDDLTYTGDPMELEMVITLSDEEGEDLEGISFQWYRYAPDTQEFEEIEGATKDACQLEGEDVNAGDYLYMCVAVVSFHSGTSYTIYGPIEVIIEKIDQEISYEKEEVTAIVGEEPFTNPLTKTTVSDEAGAGITYASSDETIATVDKNGKVTILADGTVTITATAAGTTNYEEASASYTLTVEKKLTADVTVTSNMAGDSKVYDGAGVNLTATATVEPDEADVSYQWYKKNGDGNYDPIDGATGSVYTTGSGVSASGTYVCVVTATYGTQTVTAEDAITVTIEKADQEIVFASDSVTLPVGETYTNEITGDSVIVGALTYTSSDPDVASVDEDGKVTIVGVGTAEITVTAAETENYNAASNSYTITSNDEGLSVIVTSDLDGNEKTYDGKTVILTAEAVSAVKGATFAYQWYKDDGTGNYEKLTGATEATLTLDGNVSDSGSYRCEVTVTYPNGGTDTVSAGITITIEPATQEISYGDEDVSVVYGDNETYKNETLDTTGADPDAAITYASSDETIATVDPKTGEVTILAPGTVTITATAGATENHEEASASYTLTIKEKLSLSVTVTATPESKTYDGTGISLQADVTVEPDEADVSYQWYKKNESGDYEPIDGATFNMYTTDPDVSASGTYKCVVTATYGSQTETAEDSITVTIEKADQEILFESDSVTLPVGETFTNEIKRDSVIVGDLTYKSDNEDVAIVDKDGNVTIVGVGTAQITVTAAETENYNGTERSYTITSNDAGLSVLVTSDLDGNAKDYDGKTVTLTATAVSSVEGATFTYQWYKEDESGGYVEIAGETNATLTLDGNVSDTGTYKCEVTATYPSRETGTADGSVTVTINKVEQDLFYMLRAIDKYPYDYNEPFTNDLTSVLVFGEITYTITVDETTGGDLEVTIDEETGEVTISGGTGVAIVTATAAGNENYEEASASYTLTVNPDEIGVKIEASGEGVAYDETTGAYVLTYNGENLTLSMEIILTADEEANAEEITYQWYAYDSETDKYTILDGATDADCVLSEEEVDAGEYTYVCVAEVVYQNDYTHRVYGTVEIDIAKAAQEISYETKTVNKNVDDGLFTNPLTIDKADPADGSGITYKSSDDSIATVNPETGEVTILGTGTVTITATAAGTANYEPAEASYTLKITEEDSVEYDVKYAVCLYGIQQDRYVDEYGDTEAAGLTFGPATGESYVKGYEAHLDENAYDPDSGNYCIHWMSWSEIVEQSKLDPSVFQECLENGCTKSVNLTLNDTLLDTSYAGEMDDGDGAGMLLESVKSDYRMWNSSETNTGGWPASQVRAVLNGRDGQTGSNATYALDEADALISCFPASLRNAIVAKAVKSDTAYNSRIERDNATTYDKLWLFSGKELYADSGSNNDVIRDLEGELYERSVLRGITTGNYDDLVSYNERESKEYWLLRSLYSTNRSVYAVTLAGKGNSVYANDDENGLAPGFCLPGPKLEKPTVEVTVTSDMTDNQKAYDGKEVTLTATVTYTPAEAEVTGQWYKQNEDGDYEPLEGETAATLTLPGEISDSGTYKYVATAVNYPFEATDSDEITIRIGYDVKYAVSVWGIEQDTYRKEDGSEGVAGLTFGPATGACYVDTYEAHLTEEEYESGQYGVCLHWMEWDEIIAQSKKDPTVFEDCLENGCTHSVPLLLSNTLRTSTNSTNYEELMADGDGAGYLQESLNVNFLYWTYLTNSSKMDTTGGYPASMARTVLVGEDELTNPYQAWTVGKEECLFTCLPEDLQEGIVAKAVRCDTVYNSEAEEDVTTLYDKLWLFSVREVYAGATDSYNTMRTNEGVAYQRSALLGTTAGEFNYSLALYDEDKIADPIRYWWLRTISMNYSDRAAHVCCSSGDVYNSPHKAPSETGIAPGFCLAGPEMEEPTADVTVTSNLTDNTKEYDGDEVILTATASVTPDTAQTSYQWYREDESGEFALLNGETGATLTLSGEVSDSGTYKCVVTATNGPLTATAEDAITITITEHEGYDVKYAVSIYGIQQDRYVDEYGDTEAAGLTFGPATGASYVSSYVAHLDEDAYDPDSGNYCIHWMSWDEIIAQSKEDPSVFEDCLENGCTKSVDLTLNDTLRAASYDGQMDDGDGAGMLYSSINSNYLMWNSSDTNTGGWPASQVRAVLNGKDGQTGNNATYALDEADALISCFPASLRNAIVAKPVKSDTAYNSRIERDNATTYDKLWLFSTKELYGESDGDNTAIRDLEGELYERSALLGITTDNYGDLLSYDESGGKEYWLLRSLYTNSTQVYAVNWSNGKYTSVHANDDENGLAPGFCLPGPKVEKPTVEVTVTSDMKDNQKAYDGKEVTLTATVTYTPDTAEVSGQWYKQNDKGDYEALEGETAATLTLPGEIADSGTYRYVATAVNYPFEATDSDEITIRIGYDVKYAVSVWGIEQDTYRKEDGSEGVVGLTFGPATGTPYVDDYEAHLTEEQYDAGEGYCIHWMDWDEIIAQSEEDPTVFEECLENGCTHSVPILLSDTLRSSSDYAGTMDDGDGASYIRTSVGNVYTYWNFENYNDMITDGGYPGSQIRTVLIGKNDLTSSMNLYPIEEEDCLFSGFPVDLQEGIVAKAVTCDTVYDSYDEEDVATVYDKLWLFSMTEVYADNTDNYSHARRVHEGKAYQKAEVLGTVAGEFNYPLAVYDEDGTNAARRYWWTRTLAASANNRVYDITSSSGDASPSASSSPSINGIVFGFCLPGPELEEPTVNVTVTSNLTDNTKEYDGDEVILTATASVTPDTAQTSYQWYREGESGEFALLDGETGATLTLSGEVSDSGTYKCVVTAANGPLTATAEDAITITITEHERYDVKYAVCLYAIQQDIYPGEEDEQEIAGLTFGPATGASYVHSYKAHLEESAYDPDSGNYCLHWMTWDEIIAQSEKDPTVFEECLENGCTHSVDLTLNDTLLSTSYDGQMDDGDGAGMLYSSLNSNYLMWNSSRTNTGGWPASQVRAVLNGKDDQLGGNAAYALDEADALISCFPDELKEAIIAKPVKSDTAYNSRIERDNATTYDKLWLFSTKELYGESDGDNTAIRDLEGELYERSALLGITTDNYGDLLSYDESGGKEYWLLRSLYPTSASSVYAVNWSNGKYTNVSADDDENGLAPGFCLPGPKVAQPTVDVTVTSDIPGNEKVVDGEEVTLTAATVITPDSAIIDSYQWYKKNADGDYEPIEGANADTLTLSGEVTDSGTYKCEVTATNVLFTTTGSGEITISILVDYDVKYAVCIWGIEQDTYLKEDGSVGVAGLTFGPASGDSYVDSYEAHLTEAEYEAGEGYCIHWMTWDEIIAQSEKDPTVFEDCLEHSCTHSVDLRLNDTLLGTSYYQQMDDGDGTGVLEDSIRYSLRNWVDSSSSSSNRYEGGYAASQIRTVLVGADSYTGTGSHIRYPVDQAECLYSCFPEDLQNGIVPKAVKTDTVYSDKEGNNITIYDKLWLFSGIEIFLDNGISGAIRPNEGKLYQRSAYFEFWPYSSSDNRNEKLETYREDGKTANWWMRTLSSAPSAIYVNVYGGHFGIENGGQSVDTKGLAPGFCLAGPELEEPTVNVTVTSTLADNTKEYDGVEVTLTATASVTPDTAQITSYQWYKENESGEYEAIDGATNNTLNLDGDVADSGTYKCVVTAANGPLTATAEDAITITITPAAQDISYAETEMEKTTSDGVFTNPLTETFVSDEEGGGVTYTSSDPAIASVDAESGEVTIHGAGEVTITATAAATANYKEATASYTLIITNETATVRYAVKIWAINRDTYSYDGGETTYTAGMTFGPATGANYLNGYEAHLTKAQYDAGAGYCIHWMSWDEIIAQDKRDPEVFADCLEHGCTKAVELDLNDTLGNQETIANYLEQGYDGDGVSTLYYLLNGTGSANTYGAVWNLSYDGYSQSDPADVYSRSRIRTTLTGDRSNMDEWLAEHPDANDYYGEDSLCDEGTCLLSCFPTELQEAVVPRTTLNTGNTTSGTYAGMDTKTTYDKLFLYSLKETGIDNSFDDGGGGDYGVITSDSDRIAYEVDGTDAAAASAQSWWTRSRVSQACDDALLITTGGAQNGIYVTTNGGLAPGFCLPEPTGAVEPTVDVTVTSDLKRDRKIYDGEEVTLTAAAQVTPEDAEITSYQWYKENESGGFDPIEGATGATLTLSGEASDSGTYRCEVSVAYDGQSVTGSGEIKITIIDTVVRYAVKIWGINADTYSYDDGETEETAALTFGPALGTDYLDTYTAHLTESAYDAGDGYCIHWMDWDEIIAQSEADPTVFADCLENGCTKAVELVPNETLFNLDTIANAEAQGYTGDGVSTLYYLLNGTGSSAYEAGAIWNFSMTGTSESDPADMYSRSRIRTTLTGDRSNIDAWLEENPGANDYYGVDTLCDEADCLLSCFPEELQEAIVPRTTVNAGSPSSGSSAHDKTTYDTLWLLTPKETGATSSVADDGGTDYGVISSDEARKGYEFSGADASAGDACIVWLRARSALSNNTTPYGSAVTYIRETNGVVNSGSGLHFVDFAYGLSPCFSIGAAQPEEPTVDVTVTSTLKDNTKEYDGVGVTLTATATVTPDTAQVTSYQWYKENGSGEFEEINGAIYNVLNLDGEVSDSGTYKCVVTAANGSRSADGEGVITITITEPEPYNVKYAVCIWGIKQDTYQAQDGSMRFAGLTFGPATGASYVKDYVSKETVEAAGETHDSDYCIHDMSWSEIIAQSKQDPTVFEDCLINGCTKAVNLMLNPTLLGTSYEGKMDDGDGVSVLYDSINSTYRMWNSSANNTGGWPASYIRATLNGTDSSTDTTGVAAGALDAEDSLFTCLPEVLQEEIIPKAVMSDTVYNDTSRNNVITYDKLWLFSVKESYGSTYTSASRSNEGVYYDKPTGLGIGSTAASKAPLITYNESGSATGRWTRSMWNSSSGYATMLNTSAVNGGSSPTTTTYGISFGFCLA